MFSGSFTVNTKAGKARRDMLIAGTKCMAGFSDLHARSNLIVEGSHICRMAIFICTQAVRSNESKIRTTVRLDKVTLEKRRYYAAGKLYIAYGTTIDGSTGKLDVEFCTRPRGG